MPTPPPAPARALERAFFARDAAAVARDLVGATLAVAGDGGVRRVRLVETEAYVGAHDRACHAARGRTARTAVMFGPAGHLYVYLVYGLHDLVNVVTGAEGDPQAVLLRAAEVVGGDETRLAAAGAAARGSVGGGVAMGTAGADPFPCRGPGRLARYLGLSRADDGVDVCAVGGRGVAARCWFEAGPPPAAVAVTARIGVAYAGDWAAAPLRFIDPSSRAVSGPRAANAAPARR